MLNIFAMALSITSLIVVLFMLVACSNKQDKNLVNAAEKSSANDGDSEQIRK